MIKLIFTEEDMKYFTGEPLPGFLFLNKNKKQIYTSDIDLAKKIGIPAVRKKRTKDHFFDILKEMKINKVGIDFSKMSYEMHKNFVKHKIKLVDISEELAKQMAVKKPRELQNLKEAAKLADEAMQLIYKSVKTGITEQQLAAAGQKYLEKCEAVAFPFICEFGENTLYTHYYPTAKKLKEHEMVLVDLGFRYNGYHSDLTRTFCIKPTVKQQEMFELVKYTQEKAIKTCRKNMQAGKFYSVVEKFFADNSVLEYWKYGLGHGVGLRIHEYPSLHKDSKDVIYENSVFTIEPGLAIPEIGGCRIEDTFLMKNKAVQLTKSPKVFEI